MDRWIRNRPRPSRGGNRKVVRRKSKRVTHPAGPFPIFDLPSELRVQVFKVVMTVTIPLMTPELSDSPQLSEVMALSVMRDIRNLCLCSRACYDEVRHLLWDCIVVGLSDFGAHLRISGADQRFRGKIRHLHVSEPSCYGLCYGILHCFHLRTLTISIDQVDGIFLDARITSERYRGAVLRPRARRLRLEIERLEEPSSRTEHGAVSRKPQNVAAAERSYQQADLFKGARFPYMFLNDLIPSLPRGCQITIAAQVTEKWMEVLRGLGGFTIRPVGPERYTVSYDDEI